MLVQCTYNAKVAIIMSIILAILTEHVNKHFYVKTTCTVHCTVYNVHKYLFMFMSGLSGLKSRWWLIYAPKPQIASRRRKMRAAGESLLNWL